MNTREYIESGILEAYILGALTSQEAAEVEANIALYPELKAEFTIIENTMQQYTTALAVEPPAALQEKIWNAIHGTTANAGEDAPPIRKSKTIPLQPEYRKQNQWKYAAIWIALIGSVTMNMFMWNKDKQHAEEQTAMNSQMQKLQSTQQQLAQQLGDYQKAKLMMADTGTQTIVMHTVQKDHPMAATVYWSKSKGEAYVAIDGLPQPPKGMQYQLWVMQGGKPVDMGVIDLNMANTPAMQRVAKAVTNGEAFAISLEKEGGSPTPTMQNIYVMGKA